MTSQQSRRKVLQINMPLHLARAWLPAIAVAALCAESTFLPVFSDEPGSQQPAVNAQPNPPQVGAARMRKVRTKEGPPPYPGVPATSGTSNTPEAGSEKEGNIGGLSAPGADAVMTPDLLLVNPSKPTTPEGAEPLTTAVGKSLTMTIDKRDIVFGGLRGMMITVTNMTSRPLVVDGDKATAVTKGETFKCAPLTVLQSTVTPPHDTKYVIHNFNTAIVPAAVTVGAVPTVQDMINNRKPILERYGPDQERRNAEESRFGRRILWPHQKTQGIVFFEALGELADAKLAIPASTLFDQKDAAVVSSF
jgi:hypothetical protein